MPDADNELDGCQAVLDTTAFDDEETAALRPLFPAGVADAGLADEWAVLFVGVDPNRTEQPGVA